MQTMDGRWVVGGMGWEVGVGGGGGGVIVDVTSYH